MATVLVFTEEAVEATADFLSSERAREYLERVEDLEVTGTGVTARVYGTHPYDVSLTARNGRLAGECSCPYGQEGVFCKHCVATGIVAVREGGGELRLAESRGGMAAVASAPADDPLEAWFARASKHEIIDALRDVLSEDPSLRQRLERRAAVIMRDTAAVRESVWDLVGIDGDLDYSAARKYAGRVEQAADLIVDFAGYGPSFAGHAIDFAVAAIDVLLNEYARFEDHSGAVAEAISGMFDAHLHACEIARPSPEGLAAYLASLIMKEDTGYEPALDCYVPLLGDAGRAVLRERAAELQEKDPDSWPARYLMDLSDGR